MRKRILALSAATMLILGAALVASAQTDETAADTDTVTRNHPLVEEVLDDLVADDVITEDQATAITEALSERWDEAREEFQARREEHRELAEQVREFLEDDVITAEELAQLPADSVFNDADGPLAEALEDGEITVDELENAGAWMRGFHRGFQRGAKFGSRVGA